MADRYSSTNCLKRRIFFEKGNCFFIQNPEIRY